LGTRGDRNRELIGDLCRELDLVHCADPIKSEPVYGKINYLRLHGVKRYNYRYSDEELNFLKKLISKTERNSIYVMFNNVYCFQDALRFEELWQKENLEII